MNIKFDRLFQKGSQINDFQHENKRLKRIAFAVVLLTQSFEDNEWIPSNIYLKLWNVIFVSDEFFYLDMHIFFNNIEFLNYSILSIRK